MTKTYCDVCNTEITPDILLPADWSLLTPKIPAGNLGHYQIRITPEIQPEGTQPFDLCKHCVLNAVHKLDDRPRPA